LTNDPEIIYERKNEFSLIFLNNYVPKLEKDLLELNSNLLIIKNSGTIDDTEKIIFEKISSKLLFKSEIIIIN